MTDRDQYTALYNKHGLNHVWDDPDTYTDEESLNGDGRYPPDWDDRKQAVHDLYDSKCARCRRSSNRVEGALHTHHYDHLANDGTNELSNLILLCGACHSLMHPLNDDMYGASRTEAPMFPHDDADRRVAVVRIPVNDKEKREYDNILSVLELCSPDSDEPEHSYSTYTYKLHPTDAFAAKDTDKAKQIITERQERFGLDDDSVNIALENPNPDNVSWTESSSILRKIAGGIGSLIVSFVIITIYAPFSILAAGVVGGAYFLLGLTYSFGRVLFPLFILFNLHANLWDTFATLPYNLGYIPGALTVMLAVYVGVMCHKKWEAFGDGTGTAAA